MTKFQTPNNHQFINHPITKPFGHWFIGDWSLFGDWNVVFGNSTTVLRRFCGSVVWSSQGFTILEIMVASVIAGVVALGTLTSFVTAGRIMAGQNNLAISEATMYTQDSMEYFRSNIACQAPWFDPNCTYIGPLGWTDVNALLPNAATGGSESILGTTAKRCYLITPNDCGGGPNSCYSVEVRVCWNNALVNCPC